jgi:hypothetical protein
MTLKIALKAIDQLLEQKPKGGLVTNKGQDSEARLSYQEARLRIQCIQRMFSQQGAFSFGVCASCTKWSQAGTDSGVWGDFGNCKLKGLTHRYHSCESHSKENGGWGL